MLNFIFFFFNKKYLFFVHLFLIKSIFFFHLTLLIDVKFYVGNQKLIEAHKFLLGLRSPVFKLMFWSSSRFTCESDIIKIPDIEPSAFENILRYIYTDEVVEDFKDFSSTYR